MIREGDVLRDRTEQPGPDSWDDYDLDELSGSTDLHAIVRTATDLCGVRMGAVNIITATRQRQLAAAGSPAEGNCARDDSLSAIAVSPPGRVMLPDAREEPRSTTNPFVSGTQGNVRFFAAAPLRVPETGQVLGTLSVYDTKEHALTPSQQDRLDDLAGLAVGAMELHRRTRLLAAALRAARLTAHEVERSNTALGRFADRLRRDLKGPLDRLSGLLEELSGFPTVSEDAEVAGRVSRARASTGRMRAVVDVVLEQASVGGRLEIGPVDLGAMAGEILNEQESSIRAARARVTVGRLPTVAGDALQLRAVLQTLIANAVKHRHPRRLCKVQITGERAGTGWVIRVVDNGTGIPPEHRFEALHMGGTTGRAGRTGRTTGGPRNGAPRHGAPGSGTPGSGTPGSGTPGDATPLGLAACRRIIEAHQGEISLEDTPGGGTTVVFHLPVPDPAVPLHPPGRPVREGARA